MLEVTEYRDLYEMHSEYLLPGMVNFISNFRGRITYENIVIILTPCVLTRIDMFIFVARRSDICHRILIGRTDENAFGAS